MKDISLINFFVIQVISVTIFIVIIFYLAKIITANKFNQKFSSYVINPVETDKSLENKIVIFIARLVSLFSFIASKSIFKNYLNKKYSKYMFMNNSIFTNPLSFYGLKVLLVLITLISGIIFLLMDFNYYNLILVLLIVIFVSLAVEIVYYKRFVHYLKNLNYELLNSIEIINSSLQVGLSITQSINEASKKSSKLLNQEFKYVYNDITNGLSLENSFKRMYERLNVKEVLYLSNFLSLLSKIGGNTLDTFNVLEQDYDELIKKNKRIRRSILPYKYIFYAIGFIPSLLFIFRYCTNNHFKNAIINENMNILLIFLSLVLNVIYFIIVYTTSEVKTDV